MLVAPLSVVFAADGTQEGATLQNAVGAKPDHGARQTDDTYVITPFESVSISQSQVWQDNRHRAYWSSSLLNVNGFLLFDVTQIPDNAQIVSMTLRCYLENAFGSPYSNPVVDVYYSEDDNWTRMTATPGSLSLDVLLANDIAFTSYVTYYDFTLNVAAHNWSQDLLDNRICIGFKNDVQYYSYVYFFGAYGSPTGPAPELTIVTTTGVPGNVTITMTPINPPIQIPANGGSFNFNVNVTNQESTPQNFFAWVDVTLPSGSSYGPVLGPIPLTLPALASISRVRTQTVPAAAPTGTYSYNGYVGIYPSSIWDQDSFNFVKLATGDQGAAVGNWSNSGESFEVGVTPCATPKAVRLEAAPNPFNPIAHLGYQLSSAGWVSLRIYNSAGQQIANPAEGWREAGSYTATFDGTDLPSGLYFARIQVGDEVGIQKLVLMK
jgi:hypothetical protein